MTCHNSDLESVAYHDHGYLVYSEFLLKILCMTGIAEAFAGHCPLVNRSGHQYIDVSFLEVRNRSFKRGHRCLCRLRGRLSRLHENVLWKAVHYVHPLLVDILCRTDHVRVYLLYIMDLLLVEAEDL